jgi:hypothetical protein
VECLKEHRFPLGGPAWDEKYGLGHPPAMNGGAVRGKDWVSAQVGDNECFIAAAQEKSGVV